MNLYKLIVNEAKGYTTYTVCAEDYHEAHQLALAEYEEIRDTLIRFNKPAQDYKFDVCYAKEMATDKKGVTSSVYVSN